MKNLVFLSCLLFLFACKDDSIVPIDEMDPETSLSEKLIGTWILETATISLDGQTITEEVDEYGCIVNSQFAEIECIAMEFLADQTLIIREDCVNSSGGTYKVNEANGSLEICFGSDCAPASFTDNKVLLILDQDSDYIATLGFKSVDMALNDIKRPKRDRRLLEVKRDGQLLINYTYYDDGRIKTRTSYREDEEINLSSEFSYEADKSIELRTEIASGIVRIFESFNVDTENSRSNLVDDTGEILAHNTYRFGQYDCGAVETKYFNTNNELTLSIERDFNGNNCDHTRSIRNNGGGTVSEVVYFTGDKRSPFTETHLDYLRLGSQRTIIRLEKLDLEGNPIEEDSYTAEYSFNSDDYPENETRFYLDGNVVNYTYKYE